MVTSFLVHGWKNPPMKLQIVIKDCRLNQGCVWVLRLSSSCCVVMKPFFDLLSVLLSCCCVVCCKDLLGVESTAVRGNVMGKQKSTLSLFFSYLDSVVVCTNGFSCEYCVQTKCVCVVCQKPYHLPVSPLPPCLVFIVHSLQP